MLKDPPLTGVNVVELARILAGPWAGQTLADLGADVIKIESAEGDDSRKWGPPFIATPRGENAAYFHACNRGKRSITLDLRNQNDRETARALVAKADVVIENFKTGATREWGLDYTSVSAFNPGVVYCSITGFGQSGPYASRPGYDFVVQGMSGIMDLTGEPSGEPQKIGVAFADIFSGLYAVIAIQAALMARSRTGRGQHIDIALFDCMTAVLANQAMNFLASGVSPRRLGNVHPNIAPYQTFPASDGQITIACGNDAQFARLCDALDVPELLRDPRFESNSARVTHQAELSQRLSERTSTFTRAQLLDALERGGIPAGPINTVADVFADPQFISRNMRIEPDGVPGLRTPINFSDGELSLERRAPDLGEHREDILLQLSSNRSSK
jgi:crotonobetainyl-CoA:carnitine CoA-transferase CaiB-like acyl-CoA transferase